MKTTITGTVLEIGDLESFRYTPGVKIVDEKGHFIEIPMEKHELQQLSREGVLYQKVNLTVEIVEQT